MGKLVAGQVVQTFQLYGTISDENAQSKSLAHIINKTQEVGTISNSEGFFKIHCYQNDTIRITLVGYKAVNYIVPNFNNSKYLKNFILTKDTVDLAETVIYPYPGTIAALKHEILNNPPVSEPEVNLHLEMADIEPVINEGFVIKGPITKLYETFSRHGKIQRKYQALLKADQIFAHSSKVYNHMLVRKLTGLKEKNEIIEFMEFCDLEPEYILNSTTYEICLSINKCFEEYKLIR